MTVVYDSKVVIQLRDQEGRLYPVSGASYNAADNGYVTTMKAGESKTFGWYGTDGAGYHKAGTLAKPADIWLDLNVTVSTQAKDPGGCGSDERPCGHAVRLQGEPWRCGA